MCGLMIRGNMLSFPLFLFGYLLIVKYDWKKLLKYAVILLCVLLAFMIPWSIRNYIHYDAFIPLSYGSGNPTLLGTYQGINFPPDDDLTAYNEDYTLIDTVKPRNEDDLPKYGDLDYATNVDAVAREKFAKYYGDDGKVLPQYENYVAMETDGIRASYRIKQWAKTDLLNMLYSYLYVKPNYMINSTFYWRGDFGAGWIRDIPRYENLLCLLVCLLAMIKKRKFWHWYFLMVVYLGNVMVYSMGFAFERYNTSVIVPKYVAMGIGLGLLAEIFAKYFRKNSAVVSE